MKTEIIQQRCEVIQILYDTHILAVAFLKLIRLGKRFLTIFGFSLEALLSRSLYGPL